MDVIMTGIITRVLPPQNGVSARTGSQWTSQEFILEHEHGQYPRSVVFRVMGEEKISKFAIQNGEAITVHLNIDCREYQGKFFNSIECWRVERQQQAQQSAVPNGVPYTQPAPQPQMTNASSAGDKLPFDDEVAPF